MSYLFHHSLLFAPFVLMSIDFVSFFLNLNLHIWNQAPLLQLFAQQGFYSLSIYRIVVLMCNNVPQPQTFHMLVYICLTLQTLLVAPQSQQLRAQGSVAHINEMQWSVLM